MIKLNKIDFSYGKLGRDILILSSGVFISQLIPLLLQPFLKRLYTPEEFGLFDVFLKSFSILVALSSLKYENAILLAKKDTDSKSIIYLSLIISIIFFLISIILIIFFGDFFNTLMNNVNSLFFLCLPISVLFYSIFNIFNFYLIRRQRFFLSSSSKVSRRISEGIFQLIIGLSKNLRGGLLIGDVVGNIVQGLYSVIKARKITSFKYISFKRIKKNAFKFRELPLYTLLPNILNTFVLGSLTFLILNKFKIEEVGYLEFAQKILVIPSVLISTAISQVVFQRVSKLVNQKKKITSLLISVTIILFLVSITFVAVIELLGVEIFTIIGGDEWRRSGEYAEILVYASAIMIVFSPLGKVLISLKRFKVNSLWEIFKFIGIISLFFIDNMSIEGYLKRYSIIIVFFYIIYGILIFTYSFKYENENCIK
ncbi:lipopolysaccharide biosynthesis protein [Galbibacter orientalis]|uniref:lipopolysaccharide biosynthesis protein n=1 Tax=Galbibacter orientalis TaxID=453852 RepID=UPI0030809184